MSLVWFVHFACSRTITSDLFYCCRFSIVTIRVNAVASPTYGSPLSFVCDTLTFFNPSHMHSMGFTQGLRTMNSRRFLLCAMSSGLIASMFAGSSNDMNACLGVSLLFDPFDGRSPFLLLCYLEIVTLRTLDRSAVHAQAKANRVFLPSGPL